MKVAITTNEGLTFIKLGDIIRFQANKNYTTLYLINDQRVIGSKNIKEYEDLLPEDIFFRIHHSHIINLNYVKSYSKGRGGNLIMEDGTSIEVAVRRKESFLSIFRP
jgi:two-component system, LytTR family, response regulator